MSDKGNERDFVLASQVAEHVICVHLGAGVEWIRQDLGEKENAGHLASPALELQHGRNCLQQDRHIRIGAGALDVV